ncbi:MAG: ribosomal protein S12 methylthiotransferase RimO [Deltaproteobacteria bacterium RIFOXYA12_FULL_61_11]|nr:MAG: ribosomal protein S12 methylthiotransferase RimO [Deltaproteobacteria bacterium RIFOXYA12_FULL_61_11]
MRFQVITLGCAKNRVDTEQMLGRLQAAGHVLVSPEEPADVRLINTCGFIGPAKEEAITTVLEAAQDKAEGRLGRIALTGCLVERYRDELAVELPEVDLFVGTGGQEAIAALLAAEGRTVAELVKPRSYDETSPRVNTLSPYSAYVKIAEGCSRACSFCVIPKLRGPLRSREPDAILREVERLVASGVREVILIAQESSSYGKDLPRGTASLPTLLRRLGTIEGLRWLRVLYLHPDDLGEELLEVMAGEPKVCTYFDVPAQHISNEVLKLMHRRRRGTALRALYSRLAAIPGAFLRTSLIVGHPGETRAHFQELLRFVRETRFHYLALFPYSAEEGTRSARLSPRPVKRTVERRYQQLWDEQSAIYAEVFAALRGSVHEALVERVSPQSEHLLEGRIAGQAPECDGLLYITDGVCVPGDLVRVRLTDSNGLDLVGEVVQHL